MEQFLFSNLIYSHQILLIEINNREEDIRLRRAEDLLGLAVIHLINLLIAPVSLIIIT